jgi:hypothetical protein
MFGSRVHRIYGGKIAGQQYAAGGFVFPLALKPQNLVTGLPIKQLEAVP